MISLYPTRSSLSVSIIRIILNNSTMYVTGSYWIFTATQYTLQYSLCFLVTGHIGRTTTCVLRTAHTDRVGDSEMFAFLWFKRRQTLLGISTHDVVHIFFFQNMSRLNPYCRFQNLWDSIRIIHALLCTFEHPHLTSVLWIWVSLYSNTIDSIQSQLLHIQVRPTTYQYHLKHPATVIWYGIEKGSWYFVGLKTDRNESTYQKDSRSVGN